MSQSDKFLWGAATSSHQVEGGNFKNDWWAWEELGNVEGGVRSGIATDHWNKFREDLRLAKDLGLNSYRFSIEWSRIEPEEGKWDETAIERYKEMLHECEELGLKPMLTLHHFTCPNWFSNDSGFANPKCVARFSNYVSKVAKSLGHLVPLWCTVNEPMVLISGSYLGRFMPPAIYSPLSASLACANLLRCHVAAYRILHSHVDLKKSAWGHEPLMVGYAHNIISLRADRKYHPLESLIASALDRLYNYSWIDATTGRKQKFYLPAVLPKAPLVPEALGSKTTDFIGINYYTKGYIQWRPRSKESNIIDESPVGVSFARRKEPSSDLGWAIYPKGLADFLRTLKKYKLPLFITENGIADRDDSRRPEFLVQHLMEIANARAEGLDIRGYYHWSLLDNFEWIKGFSPRFGLYAVDYNTLKRTPTESAHLYKKIIASHQSGAPDISRLKGALVRAEYPRPIQS